MQPLEMVRREGGQEPPKGMMLCTTTTKATTVLIVTLSDAAVAAVIMGHSTSSVSIRHKQIRVILIIVGVREWLGRPE
jgi:hypothetical protein